MSDPEARLAAALDHAIAMTTDLRYDGPGADSLATYALQDDPTLAADLALAAAVRSPDAHLFTVDSLTAAMDKVENDSVEADPEDPPWSWTNSRYAAAIIQAAKEAERER